MLLGRVAVELVPELEGQQTIEWVKEATLTLLEALNHLSQVGRVEIAAIETSRGQQHPIEYIRRRVLDDIVLGNIGTEESEAPQDSVRACDEHPFEPAGVEPDPGIRDRYLE